MAKIKGLILIIGKYGKIEADLNLGVVIYFKKYRKNYKN